METKAVFARDDTWVGVHPNRVRLTKGDTWHADHPLVLAYPEAFSDEPTAMHPRGWDPPVEQASAAPGEKRATRRG
jgi:hypothetical protein